MSLKRCIINNSESIPLYFPPPPNVFSNCFQFILWVFSTACLPVLGTLQISHNKLKYASDLEHLAECHSLSVLDVSHNHIEDPDIVNVLERMEKLVCTFKNKLWISKLDLKEQVILGGFSSVYF